MVRMAQMEYVVPWAFRLFVLFNKKNSFLNYTMTVGKYILAITEYPVSPYRTAKVESMTGRRVSYGTGSILVRLGNTQKDGWN